MIQTACYLLAKLLTLSREKYRLDIPLDDKIPFLPWTGVIYISAFVFWILGFGLAVSFPGFYRLAAAQILSCLIALGIFVAYPTRMAPPPAPPGPKGALVRLIRVLDSPPVNLFPSMHCTASWLCFLVAFGTAPVGWQVICFVWAVLIMASTLTIKQHDIADAVAGVALAQICWLLCGMSPSLLRLTQQLFHGIWRIFGL